MKLGFGFSLFFLFVLSGCQFSANEEDIDSRITDTGAGLPGFVVLIENAELLSEGAVTGKFTEQGCAVIGQYRYGRLAICTGGDTRLATKIYASALSDVEGNFRVEPPEGGFPTSFSLFATNMDTEGNCPLPGTKVNIKTLFTTEPPTGVWITDNETGNLIRSFCQEGD